MLSPVQVFTGILDALNPFDHGKDFGDDQTLYPQAPVSIVVLLVIVIGPGDVNQVLVAVHAIFFIAFSGVDNGAVGQHGPALVWYMKDVPMAFLALFVFKRGISGVSILFPVVRSTGKMDHDIFDAVPGFGIEKSKGVMGCRKMAVHTIGYKALGVVGMCGGFPGIVSRLDFVAGGAELRRRGSDHRVVGNAENRKTEKDPKTNEDDTN
jgi:hypothetical protein